MGFSKEEMAALPVGQEFTSDVVSCSEYRDSMLAVTELGHSVFVDEVLPAGQSIDYIVKKSASGNNYFCLKNRQKRSKPQNSGYNSNSNRGGGRSTYKHNLPPLTPAEVASTLRKIVANYTVPLEGKEKSLSDVLTEKLGFTASEHQSTIVGMLIASTKPMGYYEERN